MNNKFGMMALFVSIGLSACGAPSVEDFAENPELLQETMSKCVMMSPDKVKNDEACKNASVALKNMQQNVMGNIMNMMGK